MEDLKQIELRGKEIKNLPLFFRKIYHNLITAPEDEYKLIKFNNVTQSDLMRAADPCRPISKTVDYSLLKKKKDEI